VKRLFWFLPIVFFVALLAFMTTPAQADTTYVAVRGDTLSKIACMFDVSLNSLIAANVDTLPNPNLLMAGKRILIPGRDGGPINDCTTPTPAALPTVAGTATPAPTLSAATTPVAATPSGQSAAPITGANLLPNPSFEEGSYDLYGAPELQVPDGWMMEIDEGGILAPDTGHPFIRPESRIAPIWGLPAAEGPNFVYDGNWTIKVFKGGHPISFRLFTDVYLQPGTYRFVAQYFPDLVVAYDGSNKVWATQPLSGEVRFIRGTGGSGWTEVTPGVKNVMIQTFTVSSAGTVRLGVAFRTRYIYANNGFFIDGWSLQRIN
jgi:LysM repeat protein